MKQTSHRKVDCSNLRSCVMVQMVPSSFIARRIYTEPIVTKGPKHRRTTSRAAAKAGIKSRGGF